jgi:anti-anti-sigma regulatory factor
MPQTSWLKRHGPCHIETHAVGEWAIIEVCGKFTVGEPEMRFMDEIDRALESDAVGIVVDLTGAYLADDAVATATHAAHHRARLAGAELKVVVPPGRAGGSYHMAGLELSIPTFSQLGGAIEL